MVVTAPRKAQCTEDDDFMAALDRMVAENINERGKEKPPAVDISIPWQVKVSLKKPVGERISHLKKKKIQFLFILNFFTDFNIILLPLILFYYY